MNNEIKEIIEYFKDDIDFLEEELKYPNFKGRYITIRDKECEYLRKLLDCITNLKEENKNLKNEQISKYQTLKELQEENERLKKLCDKYEEEHKTTFKMWRKDLKNFEHEKNRELKSRINRQEKEILSLKEEIKELEEDKSKMFETAVKRNNQLLDRIDNAIEYLGINEEILETCEIYDVNGIEVYKILKGENNE